MKILIISSKDTWAGKRLIQEAHKAKISLKFVTADNLAAVKVKDFDVLYVRNPFVESGPKYLSKVIKLAKEFEAAGKRVVDSAIAEGHLGEGKRVDYLALMKARLPIPTISLNHGRDLKKYRLPFILKWIYGLKAKNVFLIKGQDQLKKILPLHPRKEWLVQEFVKADYEYKIITVGFKALPVSSRFKVKPEGFRIDFENHETIKSSSIPKAIVIAETASKVLGRELAKVDILQKGNKFYILEVNRFPGLEWFEKLTKFNVAKAFLEYLQK